MKPETLALIHSEDDFLTYLRQSASVAYSPRVDETTLKELLLRIGSAENSEVLKRMADEAGMTLEYQGGAVIFNAPGAPA